MNSEKKPERPSPPLDTAMMAHNAIASIVAMYAGLLRSKDDEYKLNFNLVLMQSNAIRSECQASEKKLEHDRDRALEAADRSHRTLEQYESSRLEMAKELHIAQTKYIEVCEKLKEKENLIEELVNDIERLKKIKRRG